MFSGMEQMAIWSINRNIAGRAEDSGIVDTVVPSFEQLKKLAAEALLNVGFSMEETTHRNDANCIIRIYHHPGMALFGDDHNTFMYGYEAYVESCGYFRCKPCGKKIDFAEQQVTIINNGKLTKVGLYSACFKDYFVKLTAL